MSRFGLLGAGGQADETAEYALPDAPAFRAVSAQYLGDDSSLVDLATTDSALLATPVVVAVGAPAIKKELVALWGGTEYVTVVSSSAWVATSASVSAGCILAPFSAISSHAKLGKHVLVNIGASVSHDVTVGDFVTISPGARIGGRARLGDGVFVGIGAVVSNDVSVASGAVIGAGAVVVSDLTEPGIYAGVPARLIRGQEGWLRAI